MDGKVAADRAAMLIINIERTNSKISIVILAEIETNKARVLEYGADDFATSQSALILYVDWFRLKGLQ